MTTNRLLILLATSLFIPPVAYSQNSVVTYQGHLTSGGAPFSGLGRIKVALVTSTNSAAAATAVANVTGGFVTSYNVVSGGNGYGTVPTVTIVGGGGSGATAVAVISGGVVTAINPVSAGSGYSSPPGVVISVPPPSIAYTTYWSNDGSSVAGSEPSSAIDILVTNGLVRVPLGDTNLQNMSVLPRTLFSQPDLSLRIWFSDGVNGFAALEPAQLLSAAPYAFTSANADRLTGTVAASQISGALAPAQLPAGVITNGATMAGTFSGNGAGLNNVDATLLGGVPSTGFWRTGGNAGVNPATGGWLGTSDNLPFEIRVNGGRVLRLEPVTFVGSPNIVAGSPRNFIGAGINGATVSGGGATNFGGLAYTNGTFGSYSVVAGGLGNRISTGADYSVLGGGANNLIWTNSAYSTVNGGGGNVINNTTTFGTIGGGGLNDVGTNSSRSTIGGGYDNTVQNNSTNATIAGGGKNIIGSDAGNTTIAGGFFNQIRALSIGATVAGGSENNIWSLCGYSFIGGGVGNEILTSSQKSVIAGGTQNSIQFTNLESAICGGWANAIAQNGLRNFIGGGGQNVISRDNYYSTIAGGNMNKIGIQSNGGVISGGVDNRVDAVGGTVGGGDGNSVSQGSFNTTIGGGNQNRASSDSSYATIGGGSGNFVLNNASFATIPGGLNNSATNYAFAAGRQAQAVHTGSFVWGDSTAANVVSAAPNSVTMRASGGFRLFSNTGASIGVSLAANGNAWAAVSDRNRKKDVEPLDGAVILEKLAKIPVSSWHYDFETSNSTPHIGPMAQDFKAAFYPGRDDKTISTMEFDGVALAAIQGLNEKVESRMKDDAALRRGFETKLRQKDTEIAELKESLHLLKELVHSLNRKIEGEAR